MIEVDRRPARESDREFARRAHHTAYRDVVERQFGPWDEAVQDQFFDHDWNPEATQIIRVDGLECGYCIVEHRPQDIHVRELVIHPTFQGRGVGTRLLHHLQEEAVDRQVPVRLGTFHQNHALQLYGRVGFRRIGTTETHVLMEWRPADAGD